MVGPHAGEGDRAELGRDRRDVVVGQVESLGIGQRLVSASIAVAQPAVEPGMGDGDQFPRAASRMAVS